jgi:hypothetical protein
MVSSGVSSRFFQQIIVVIMLFTFKRLWILIVGCQLTLSLAVWQVETMSQQSSLSTLVIVGLSLFPMLSFGTPTATLANEVILLNVAVDEIGVSRESRFADELRMSLDGLDVREVRLANDGFIELSLGRQIAEVRPLFKENCTVATVWLSQDSPELLLLHLVAVSTGRALVRLVETEINGSPEKELAVATRELLGTAYLFENSNEQKSDNQAIERVVESVREQTRPPERANIWSILLGGRGQTGIVGNTGPSLWLGGELGVDLALVDGLHWRLGFAGAGGPIGDAGQVEVDGWMVTPFSNLLYLWTLDSVSLGPFLEIGAVWTNLEITTEHGARQPFLEVFFKSALGLELQWHAASNVALLARGGLGVLPQQDRFNRVSDGQIVLATPYLTFDFTLGILVDFR